MTKFDKLKNQRWFAYTFAACVAVVLYLLLSKFPSFWAYFKIFLGYFNTLIIGGVIAYILNPVVSLLDRTVFKRVKNEKARWNLSIGITAGATLILLGVIVILLVPQLVESIKTFLDSLGGYYDSIQQWFSNLGVSLNSQGYNLRKILASSESIISYFVQYIKSNSEFFINASTNIGAGVFNFVISFILSIYFLIGKINVLRGGNRLLKAVLSPEAYEKTARILSKSNAIVSRYMVFTIVDAAIVGIVNCIFMIASGMDYPWLVSVVVALTNFVPTFGPFIGGAIGAFIIFMVNPGQAIVFIIFTLILQLIDGYILKPKLFGDSLGVSGLLILAAIIVFGKMFGVVGIILSIPVIAILDYIYKSILLPGLESRHDAKYHLNRKDKNVTENNPK